MGRFDKLEIPDSPRDEVERSHSERDYLELGDRALREGAYEAALRYYSRALGHDEKLERAWLGQILCLISLGELEEAITWADRARGLFPHSADIVAAKAVAWGRNGDFEKATGFSDSSLKLDDASSFVWWARGDVLIAANPRNAVHCFNKASEIGKDDPQLLFWIAKTFLSVDMPAEARRFLLRAERLDPDNPVLWHFLGLASKALGMFGEAQKAFEQVLNIDPRREEAKLELAEMKRNRLALRAKERFRKWLK